MNKPSFLASLAMLLTQLASTPTAVAAPTLAESIDVLCQSRNHKELIKLATPAVLAKNTFQFLLFASPYGTSPAKWRASALEVLGLANQGIMDELGVLIAGLSPLKRVSTATEIINIK